MWQEPRQGLATGLIAQPVSRRNLLRGPLVGFTDETLLDAVAAQPPVVGSGGEPLPAQLSLRMDLDIVPDPLLRETLLKLRSLARRTMWSMNPYSSAS